MVELGEEKLANTVKRRRQVRPLVCVLSRR
jgi:hypothetical protein